MKKCLLVTAACFLATSAMAGGYMSNTNLSATFLRNPARDAAISIDGLYSNPAGVTFLNPGLHVQISWQSAFQHRYIDTEFDPFKFNYDNRSTKRHIEGKATAPVIPSLHISYNRDRWFAGFSAGLVGGGGKCIFNEGLSSFESLPAAVTAAFYDNFSTYFNGNKLENYDFHSYMRGKQFYLGYQLGGGYKITDNLALYAGLRATQAVCNYYGYIKDIQIYVNGGKALPASETMIYYGKQILANAQNENQQKLGQTLIAYGQSLEDVVLNCDQNGVGWAPILGFDYKLNEHWNFSGKYEFRTKMNLKNQSANMGGEYLEPLKQFANGAKIREDIPAIATLGVEYSPMEKIRISAGYHQYFDKDAEKYQHKQHMLDGDTWEALLGIEYDVNEHLTLSCGGQSTNYGNTDSYMNDLSFTTSSCSIGLGLSYRFNEHWTLDTGYFQTFYTDYSVDNEFRLGASNVNIVKRDTYSRDNKSCGVALTMNF